jgi:hypothetical protein
MNKDAFLATFIGFLLGVVIFSVIVFGPKLTRFFPKVHFPSFSITSIKLPWFNKTSTPAKKTDSTNSNTTLSISSPLPDTIAEEETLLVSGNAPKGMTIIIGGPLDEEIVSVSDTGSYAGKISLREGKNDISVSALSSDANMEQTVTVFYTPEKF